MNIFPDRNDPFESQSTLQHSFTSAHRVPRKTYSKRGRPGRDGQNNVKSTGAGPAASAIAARTNSKVARVKAKNESELGVFEFDDNDDDHDYSWVQRRTKKARTKPGSGSDGMEIESSSSNRRSSPSPTAPVSSQYFAKGSKGITPGEWKNVSVPAAPRKSSTIASPSKAAVLKEFVNEAWKFRDEIKTKPDDDGDDTVAKRPSKVRIMSKAEEIMVNSVSIDGGDDDHSERRRRSQAKSKSSVKQEKPVGPICSTISLDRPQLSVESDRQKRFAVASDPNQSLPARMKRINLSSGERKAEEEDEIEDDIYDMTGPISTSTPNRRNASTVVSQDQEVPRTKKLFTVKTDMGRLAISPVKNNRNNGTKRVTLGRIPDLSVPVTTQNSIAHTRKSRSGISVYRDVPGISPVKHDSGSELERNTAANRDSTMGIKVCGAKKANNLQSVVQSHVRLGNLSRTGKNSTKNPPLPPPPPPTAGRHAMSRYGRRVIYEEDEEDELAL
ncbi:hypothetical protein V1525DRAFT_404001 [Lipomyces kononenkoae]|uniref:Uncharacterized protein n=1 Tax=Lipomyces kononenkoae TaxID=34357 RepID=A0ACC3T180_LIPKO